MGVEREFDAIVVGGGFAGMVAGVRAAELGLNVAVLEKGNDAGYACNSRFSGGIFHVAYRDPKGSVADRVAGIDRVPYEDADPAVTKTLAERSPEIIDWFLGLGVRFMRDMDRTGGWILTPPRPLVGGLNHEGKGPDLLLRRLSARLAELGGHLLLGHRATGLYIQNGVLGGVNVETADGSSTLLSHAVVLADGGFQGNLDMLREHITPQPEALRQRGAATGVGDGIRMAQDVGAEVTSLYGFYGHLLSRDAHTNWRLWPYPQLDEIGRVAIVVDESGKRFADEGAGGIYITNVLASQPNPLGGTLIFDQTIWETDAKAGRIPPNPQLEVCGATIHRAPTVGKLAELAGIPVDMLERTIADYNRAVTSGGLDALSPPRSDASYKPRPIATAPFYAVPLCAGITHTMGGIRIDGDARVLGEGGQPIEGLYAAGSTVGGLEGGPQLRYVGGLTRAGLFGMIAANHIAATAKRPTQGSRAPA